MVKPILILAAGALMTLGLFLLVNKNDSGTVVPYVPVISQPDATPPREEEAVDQKKPTPSKSVKSAPASSGNISENTSSVNNSAPAQISTVGPCNPSLIGSDGFDRSRVISKEACDLLNNLYKEGKAAGNSSDTYENRDGLHVNLCEGWTPNPDCPILHRFFTEHEWLLSGGVGRATGIHAGVTVGQASFSGESSGYEKHSIAYSMYKSQSGADILYSQYTHNNLYIYPSLEESKKDNIANTPYVISSEDIVKNSDGTYYAHNASGSDLPFVKIALLGLASFKPEVKKALADSSLLIPTLQMLIRHSHRSVNSETDYLNSDLAHEDTYHANYLSGGIPEPSYNSAKLVRIANELSIYDIPPLVQLNVVSENFTESEKLFNTPGAVARSVTAGTSRAITISAENSFDLGGSKLNHVYEWKILKGDASKVKITVDPNNRAVAKMEFTGGTAGERLDVGLFIKKQNGKYYSVPGIISVYSR